nr:L,D-transpeptidase [Bosea vaviloviae]
MATLAGLGLLAAATSAHAYEIDPLTRQPLMQTADPAKAQATAIPRELVSYDGKQRPGTIVINTSERRLYYVMPDGKAMRYGVGVGRPGFDWAGSQSITRKAEWPSWTPPSQMLKRRPDLPRFMPGGPENPLGARAMYLGSTLYRIHGSNEPETIGQAVSSGCIRMLNEDVIDLYERAKVGTRVVVAR